MKTSVLSGFVRESSADTPGNRPRRAPLRGTPAPPSTGPVRAFVPCCDRHVAGTKRRRNCLPRCVFDRSGTNGRRTPSRNARRPGWAWRVPPPARPGPVRSRAVNRCNASERRSSEHVGAPSIQNRCARRANEWQTPSRNARRPGWAWRVPPPARPGPVRSRAVNRCNASERRSSEHVGAPSIQNRCARRANEWQTTLPKRAPAGMGLEGPATGAPGTRTLARVTCNASERRSSEHVGAPSIQNRCARRANEWQTNPPETRAGRDGLGGSRHRRARDPYARARLTDAMRRNDDQVST